MLYGFVLLKFELFVMRAAAVEFALEHQVSSRRITLEVSNNIWQLLFYNTCFNVSI